MRIIFQGGDNMLGRAVQLTLPFQSPGDAEISDSQTAEDYLESIVDLNELDSIRQQNLKGGRYLWGDLPKDLGEDVRVLNLECAPTLTVDVTENPGKGILYHCNLYNVPIVLSGFRAPLVLSLANNHSLDMGRTLFEDETLRFKNRFLENAIGIGSTVKEATKPMRVGKFTIYAFGAGCSGVPSSWGATRTQSGIGYLPPINSTQNVNLAFDMVKQSIFKSDDCVCISIHWGPNWAESQDDGQNFRVELAHRLIDELGVDLIYGHSSHHIRGIELYKGKLILYGCGDLINDYEQIQSRLGDKLMEAGALFVVDLDDATYDLKSLDLIPIEIVKLQTRLISDPDKIQKVIDFVNHQSELDSPNPLILEV